MGNPSIEIDREAVRFTGYNGTVNLFWSSKFGGVQNPSFQSRVMENLHLLYDECVRGNVIPDIHDEETD